MIAILGITANSHPQSGKFNRQAQFRPKVTEETILKAEFKMPYPIFVKVLSTENTVVKGDKSDETDRVAEKKQRVSQKLAPLIVEKLVIAGHTAAVYDDNIDTRGALILDGEISTISNGSGATRVWIGFGAGAAKMITNIHLYFSDSPEDVLLSQNMVAKTGGSGGIGGFGAGGNMEDQVNERYVRKLTLAVNELSAAIAAGNVPQVGRVTPKR